MHDEIAALDSNDVWSMTKHSPGTNAFPSKWVSKIKTRAEGELER